MTPDGAPQDQEGGEEIEWKLTDIGFLLGFSGY
jgi:hypothetical protein